MITGTVTAVSKHLGELVSPAVARAVRRAVVDKVGHDLNARIMVDLVPAGRSLGVDILVEDADPDLGLRFRQVDRLLVGPRGGVSR